MNQTFNQFGYETPGFILCNPDGTQISELACHNRKITLRYNDTSELSFSAYDKYTDDSGFDQVYGWYELLEPRRQILVDGIGYFVIQQVDETSTKTMHQKDVVCKSAQYELAAKTVDYLNGTYKFYDAVSNTDENGNPQTIMGLVLSLAPGWTVGTIDTSLASKYRTMDLSGVSVLDFLYNKVEEAFQCVVEFDFLEKKISATLATTLGENPDKTDVYLSFDNVMKNIKISEYEDEIKTKLYVYGQDLNINLVNPLGTNYILNIDHYLNTKWLPQALITKWMSWKTLFGTKQAVYSQKLVSYQDIGAALTTAEAELAGLKGEVAKYETLVSVCIEGGNTESDSYTGYVSSLEMARANVSAKETEISGIKTRLAAAYAELEAINNAVKLSVYFTAQELSVLEKYFIDGTYQNDNYIVTDSMTNSDIQSYAQELYNEGQTVLTRVSQPRYTLTIDAENFIFLQDFSGFTNEIGLGKMIYAEKDEDTILTPILLEMSYSWDDPSDFSMTFGNRFRAGDTSYAYTELLANATATSGQVSSNWSQLVDFSRNYKDTVSSMISDAFNVALKDVVSSANQEMTWGSGGMTFRKCTPNYELTTDSKFVRGVVYYTHNAATGLYTAANVTAGSTVTPNTYYVNNTSYGSYDNEQIKIVNNRIVFTDDGWDSLKTVIGKINLDSGGTAYGIVAEALVGKLIAGNTLTIANDTGTLTVDGDGFGFHLTNPSVSFVCNNDGVSIVNASLLVSSGGNSISIDPQDGLKIRNGSTDVFYADGNGNLVLTANITAAGGSVGGWKIGSDFIGNNASKTNATVGLQSSSGISYNGSPIRFWAGATPGSSVIPFCVTENGTLYASGVTITGKVTSGDATLTGGRIGGFTIDQNSIYSGTKSHDASTDSGIRLSIGGIFLGSYNSLNGSCPFQVTNYGVMTANGGFIGGWTIDPDRISSSYSGVAGSSNVNAAITLYSSKSSSDKWIETWDYNSSKGFSVGKNGLLTANNADISGKITATSGGIGGWTIGSDYFGNANTRSASTVGLQSGNVNWYGSSSQYIRFWAGAVPGSSNIPFCVTSDGALWATKGTIGGYSIGTDALYKQTSSSSGGISVTDLIGLYSNGSNNGYFVASRTVSQSGYSSLFRTKILPTGIDMEYTASELPAYPPLMHVHINGVSYNIYLDESSLALKAVRA